MVGIADTWVATKVLVPAFGGRSNYYWAYTALGSNIWQAAWHLVIHPVSSLRLLITPRVKLTTVLWLFGAFCFLPLRSPIALATVPLLLERMLANLFPNWWVTSFHYNAFLVVVLAFAAADGAARLDRWAVLARAAQGTGTVALGCAAAMCAVALVLVPRFALGTALHPSFYQRNAQMNAAAAADAAVPDGVTVEAANHLGPQLSARDTVLLWERKTPRWARWVVADVGKQEFTFTSLTQQIQRVALLERNGYQVVFQRRGYVVLHRPAPGITREPQAPGRTGGQDIGAGIPRRPRRPAARRTGADAAGRLLGQLSVLPALLVMAWLLAGLPLLLAGGFTPVPMLVLSVPLAVVLVVLGLRWLPARWPGAAGAAGAPAARPGGRWPPWPRSRSPSASTR